MARKKKVVKEIRFECRDCGDGFSTALEFSDHAHDCAINPVPWNATQDYTDAIAERLFIN